MSRTATYLRGYIEGEVTTRQDVRQQYQNDKGALTIKPEIVVFPRVTNDIRKIASFVHQLSEKGYPMSLAARGAGLDTTGASLTKGILLDVTKHMNEIFEYDSRQKLVRLQPGASIKQLQDNLNLFGVEIPQFTDIPNSSSVGGVIANGVHSSEQDSFCNINSCINQLEVILSNGDIIQTGRLSKREVNTKKGLQSLEGDIYRGIDRILEEYAETISNIDPNDNTGYNSISKVGSRDGSIDLTPLFVGAQGTLGIISEMILKAEPSIGDTSYCALIFKDTTRSLEVCEELTKRKIDVLKYIDARLIEQAISTGKNIPYYTSVSEDFKPSSIVLVGISNPNHSKRKRALKRIQSKYKNEPDLSIYLPEEDDDSIKSLLDITEYVSLSQDEPLILPKLYENIHVPKDKTSDFFKAIDILSKKYARDMPIIGDILSRKFSLYPIFNLLKITDKQKLFKLIDDLSIVVNKLDCILTPDGAEGKTKARFIYTRLNQDLTKIYKDIQSIFDPHGVLINDNKSTIDIRNLIQNIRQP